MYILCFLFVEKLTPGCFAVLHIPTQLGSASSNISPI